MRRIVKTHKRKLQYVAPVFIVGALSFAVLGFGGNPNNPENGEPFIQDLEPFVLVAENSIHLSGSTQTSSGDIASNKSMRVSENGIINGNLFSNRIQLADNSSINGNAIYNRLIKAQSAEIFGEQTNSIQKNIVELPQVSNFQTGTLSHVITENTTLIPGNYDTLEVKEGVTLTLLGTYNINKLILRDNSTLIAGFNDDLRINTINIKDTIKIQNNTLIILGNPAQQIPTDLRINYTGKISITIGDNSFITARILSPDSRVQLGNKTTYLGQILAKDINVGEEGSLSRDFSFEKESDPDKIIESEDGILLVVNEVIILMNEDATLADMLELAEIVDGQLTGFLPFIGMSKIEISSNTIEEQSQKVEQIKDLNNPNVFDVIPNFIF